MKTIQSNCVQSQQRKILEWLRSGPLSTYQARTELDIFHPAARVQELRSQGHNIHTYWETVDTGQSKHRVAKYVLFAGGA